VRRVSPSARKRIAAMLVRGKVGGHRDELTAHQIARLDRMLASRASRFGY
jgi:hypothetical protein